MSVSSEIGKIGEQCAADDLVYNGYQIIARNYRKRNFGEIDIIATKSKTIHFVEVKTRCPNAMVSALESVTKIKQRRIIKTAEIFLLEKGTNLIYEEGALFDVYDILTKHNGEILGFKFYEDAFCK